MVLLSIIYLLVFIFALSMSCTLFWVTGCFFNVFFFFLWSLGLVETWPFKWKHSPSVSFFILQFYFILFYCKIFRNLYGVTWKEEAIMTLTDMQHICYICPSSFLVYLGLKRHFAYLPLAFLNRLSLSLQEINYLKNK